MTDRVVLLDVDGVVNALWPTTPDCHPAHTWIRAEIPLSEGGGHRLLCSTVVLDALRTLPEDSVRWVSTLQDDCAVLSQAIPVVHFDHLSGVDDNSQKVRVVEDFLSGGDSQVLWVDSGFHHMNGVASLVDSYSDRLSLLSPLAYRGLTVLDIEAITDFLYP